MSVGGTWGKLLHVDLSTKRHWVEEPSDEFYLKLAGGRGLGRLSALARHAGRGRSPGAG